MDTINFDKDKYDLRGLMDSKHPVMEKFKDKAPGTYKHCQNVANLCEAVAMELDIDPIVMKVLGMYHDIGKTLNPDCFYENQNGSGNIHDRIEPMISFHLISKHISDSALILCQMEDFPHELIIPITQHHGNTVIKSLAIKGNGIEEDMFRYRNTTPPTTIEAAVLMLCDSVEATVRSKEHSKEPIENGDIDKIIMNTINRLESDDQLDEVRVGDLKKIKKALKRDLESTYHKRIDYDTIEDVRKEKGDNKDA